MDRKIMHEKCKERLVSPDFFAHTHRHALTTRTHTLHARTHTTHTHTPHACANACTLARALSYQEQQNVVFGGYT